jgi:hypothetical protein
MVSLDRQWDLPAGYDSEGRLVTLREILAQGVVAEPQTLTRPERNALVLARWEAGEWSDVLICGELITLDRAIRELEGQTEIGEDLLSTSERALEMVLEDAGGAPR